jgi:glycosyltransferase involved in cell wall biosynthesis
MKVGFISRATLFSSPGGDTRQIEQTAMALRKKGVDVDIYLSTDRIDYSKYDLLHFFNIIRPADIIMHAKKARKPFVVSTIFVEYGSVKDQKKSALGVLKSFMSDGALEYLKAIARWIKNGEKVVSMQYLLWGHVKSVRWVARNASCLLPNSQSEYNRFRNKYNIDQRHIVVPNGIESEKAMRIYPESEKYKNAILCMGRIEARKNQLNLIRALNNTIFKLFIHGKPSPNNIGYYKQCIGEAANNVSILGWLDDEELYTAYSNAKVHILPSYFETTGLSSLEAAIMGCNIVVTDRGDTKDYFRDYAWYCEPDNPDSIRKAVEAAFEAPYNESFKQYILKHYTWDEAAVQTLSAYNKVLRND